MSQLANACKIVRCTHGLCLIIRVRRARTDEKNPKSCDEVFERLITEGFDADDLYSEVTNQVSALISGSPVFVG